MKNENEKQLIKLMKSGSPDVFIRYIRKNKKAERKGVVVAFTDDIYTKELYVGFSMKHSMDKLDKDYGKLIAAKRAKRWFYHKEIILKTINSDLIKATNNNDDGVILPDNAVVIPETIIEDLHKILKKLISIKRFKETIKPFWLNAFLSLKKENWKDAFHFSACGSLLLPYVFFN